VRAIVAVVLPLLLMTRAASGEEAAWTIVLHPSDFVIGDALKNLKTRHTWAPGFDEGWGAFDVALHKKAAAVPAPHCRMDYLILKIPTYYPENPKKASVAERRAVYDALVALRTRGTGSFTARVEAPVPIGQMSGGHIELTACNLYFALPLSVQTAP
jgi:hypothetical protein